MSDQPATRGGVSAGNIGPTTESDFVEKRAFWETSQMLWVCSDDHRRTERDPDVEGFVSNLKVARAVAHYSSSTSYCRERTVSQRLLLINDSSGKFAFQTTAPVPELSAVRTTVLFFRFSYWRPNVS